MKEVEGAFLIGAWLGIALEGGQLRAGGLAGAEGESGQVSEQIPEVVDHEAVLGALAPTLGFGGS